MKSSTLLLSAVLYSGFYNNAMALSTETNICIRNKTNYSHYIESTDIDSYDWDGDDRPDKNFNYITIRPGETVCKKETLNAYAREQAFVFMVDSNPTRVQYLLSILKNPDGYIYEEKRWGAYTNKSNPTALHGENTIYYQPSDWWVGYECAGEKCTTFELR